jgi:hypothetical protein
MKAALKHLGLDIGDPAPPYRGLSPAVDAALGEFLASSAFRPVQLSARDA